MSVLLPQARRGREVKAFYTIPEYEAWKESLDHNLRGWDIKYYKGLGTSTAEEAKEYFSRLDKHRKEFVWAGKAGLGPSWQGHELAPPTGIWLPSALGPSSLVAACAPTVSTVALQVTRTATPSSWPSARSASTTARSGCPTSCRAPSWTSPLTRSRTRTSSTGSVALRQSPEQTPWGFAEGVLLPIPLRDCLRACQHAHSTPCQVCLDIAHVLLYCMAGSVQLLQCNILPRLCSWCKVCIVRLFA